LVFYLFLKGCFHEV